MSQETLNAIEEARDYFNEIWNEGYCTPEMSKYQNKVEKIFETLGIEPDYA